MGHMCACAKAAGQSVSLECPLCELGCGTQTLYYIYSIILCHRPHIILILCKLGFQKFAERVGGGRAIQTHE